MFFSSQWESLTCRAVWVLSSPSATLDAIRLSIRRVSGPVRNSPRKLQAASRMQGSTPGEKTAPVTALRVATDNKPVTFCRCPGRTEDTAEYQAASRPRRSNATGHYHLRIRSSLLPTQPAQWGLEPRTKRTRV